MKPTPAAPKGAIVYLAPPGHLPHRKIAIGRDAARGDLDNFIRSLTLLRQHYLERFPCPVLVFYEEGFNEAMRTELVEATGVTPRFVPVTFDIPDFLDRAAVPERYLNIFPVGYRHMCRFFSGLLFRQPALAEFDWYWRLDTDSFIQSDVPDDLFAWMQGKGYTYGYNHIAFDDEVYVEGLWEAHQQFLQERKIKPTFLDNFVQDGAWNRGCFYTNFEITNLAFWRSPLYQEYFDYLDRLGGIYFKRWGDAPIHTLALASFVPLSEVHQFRTFAYEHYPFSMDANGKVAGGWGDWFHLKRTAALSWVRLRQSVRHKLWSLRQKFPRF